MGVNGSLTIEGKPGGPLGLERRHGRVRSWEGDLPEGWQHDAGDTGDREAVRPRRISGPGMRRARASGARAVRDDPLIDKIAHRGSECPTPAGSDAEERGRVIWVEGLDGVANPRE